MPPLSDEEFSRRSKETHGDRYCYKFSKYKNWHTPVEITCREHGPFLQAPGSHFSGAGCPDCGREKARLSRMLKKTEFIERSRAVHGDKYSYEKSDLSGGSKTPVTITCPEHGDFPQSPSSHMGGSGCPHHECSGFRNTHLTREEFIVRASKVHGDAYRYGKVEYLNNVTPVEVECREHGIFKVRPSNLLSGKGCPRCGDLRAAGSKRLTTEEYIRRAREAHGDRFDYSITKYTGCREGVDVICKEHGPFRVAVANNHLQGTAGCRRCRVSSGEIAVENAISKLGFEFVPQWGHESCKNIFSLRYDFCIPSLMVLIEYDGMQHYKSIPSWGGDEALEKTKLRDSIKNQWAADNGYRIIRIPYWDKANIYEILKIELSVND